MDVTNQIENEIKLQKFNKKQANVFRRSCKEVINRTKVRNRLRDRIAYKGLSFQQKFDLQEKK